MIDLIIGNVYDSGTTKFESLFCTQLTSMQIKFSNYTTCVGWTMSPKIANTAHYVRTVTSYITYF